MPRIIPVLDVLRGQAVHARGGRRKDYRPVRSAMRPGSDPVALALAIRGGHSPRRPSFTSPTSTPSPKVRPRTSWASTRAIADLGLAVWVDAAVRGASGMPGLLGAGIARVVVGLETLAGPPELARIVECAGP